MLTIHPYLFYIIIVIMQGLKVLDNLIHFMSSIHSGAIFGGIETAIHIILNERLEQHIPT